MRTKVRIFATAYSHELQTEINDYLERLGASGKKVLDVRVQMVPGSESDSPLWVGTVLYESMDAVV